MNQIKCWCLVFLGCYLVTAGISSASAENLDDRIDTLISFRSDVWSGSRYLDDVSGISQISLWGRAKFNLNSAGMIFSDGWLLDQTPGASNMTRGRLREVYWRYNLDSVELKIGRQLVVWGRADGINPTDNLTPHDFTLLTPEDGDQRFGNEAIQLSFNTGFGNLSSLWFPHAASNTIPLPLQTNVHYEIDNPQQSEWAIKLDSSGEGIDGSLSYFNGIDPTPDIGFGSIDPTGIIIAVRNHKVQIFGTDFSMSRGNIIWRGEAAWMQTESTGQDDFTHKKPQLTLVGGGEWPFGNGTTLGLQAVFQQVPNFQSPDSIAQTAYREVAWRQASTSSQISEKQYGLIFRLASRWWNETLMVETSAIIIRPSDSGIWRTKLNYEISDHWNLLSGFDYYFGLDRSYFGQLEKNSLVYVQLRYGM